MKLNRRTKYHVPRAITSILALAAVIATIIVAGCHGKRSVRYSSEEQSSSESSFSITLGQLPPACANQEPQREYDLDSSGQPYSVECSCVAGNAKYMWYNPVMPGDDPATHCRPATRFFQCDMNPDGSCHYPGFIPPEPPAFPSPSSSVNTAVAPSTHWSPPASSPSASAAAPPAPPAAKPQTQYAAETRELDYKCTSGSSAIRNFLLVTGRNGVTSVVSVQQQCVGPGVVCLSNATDKSNTAKPPCTCSDGKAPELLSRELNTWACNDKPTYDPPEI